MVVILTAIGVVFATVADMLVGKSAFAIPYNNFLSLQLHGIGDVDIGVTKAFSYGIAISVIASQAGLATTGGSAGVGWAATSAVVNTSFAVIVVDFVISALAFLVH